MKSSKSLWLWATLFVAVVLVLGMLLPAFSKAREVSYHFTGNAELDYSLVPGPDPSLVVAGTIERIIPLDDREIEALGYGDAKGLEEAQRRNPGAPVFKHAIEFHVSAVIQGDEVYKDMTLNLPLRRFHWPTTLVPLKEGAYCILVIWKLPAVVQAELQRGGWVSAQGLEIVTVVPAHSRQFSACKDSAAAKLVLGKEILAVLKEEKSPDRQYELTMLLAPILSKEDAPEVAPYLKGFPNQQQEAIKKELVKQGILKPEDIAVQDNRKPPLNLA